MKKLRRCAIYTRKSTEEGLEQEFNSLDAQREACEAYIKSQAGEGWRLVRNRYDDGGISGGAMDRPALQRLLGDIRIGKVDAIIVYKVDRLTRSLTDFAKIVDVFDSNGVSFVSVTQSFNTTSSMGRLTLNMLLSFAQFEREVTSERIRDKIAASKKKGMWMGGVVPLGYNAINRKLIVNHAEAETVRTLFDLYLKLGTVRQVKIEADKRRLRTKTRVPNNKKRSGGGLFAKGHIYAVLANPLYIGETVHKGNRYPGEHEAIIDANLWVKVQAQLKQNAVNRHSGTNAKNPSLLCGLLRDGEGRSMQASHAKKRYRRYRYYVSKPNDEANQSSLWRLPAPAVEIAVAQGIIAFLENRLQITKALHSNDGVDIQQHWARAELLGQRFRESTTSQQRSILLKIIDHITVRTDQLDIEIRVPALLEEQEANDGSRRNSPHKDDATFTLKLPITLKRRGVELRLVVTDQQIQKPVPDTKLIKTIARCHRWVDQLLDGEAQSVRQLAEANNLDQGDVSRMLPLGFLAPDIIEAIIAGEQPAELTSQRLKRLTGLPIEWAEQRRVLGFA